MGSELHRRQRPAKLVRHHRKNFVLESQRVKMTNRGRGLRGKGDGDRCWAVLASRLPHLRVVRRAYQRTTGKNLEELTRRSPNRALVATMNTWAAVRRCGCHVIRASSKSLVRAGFQ